MPTKDEKYRKRRSTKGAILTGRPAQTNSTVKPNRTMDRLKGMATSKPKNTNTPLGQSSRGGTKDAASVYGGKSGKENAQVPRSTVKSSRNQDDLQKMFSDLTGKVRSKVAGMIDADKITAVDFSRIPRGAIQWINRANERMAQKGSGQLPNKSAKKSNNKKTSSNKNADKNKSKGTQQGGKQGNQQNKKELPRYGGQGTALVKQPDVDGQESYMVTNENRLIKQARDSGSLVDMYKGGEFPVNTRRNSPGPGANPYGTPGSPAAQRGQAAQAQYDPIANARRNIASRIQQYMNSDAPGEDASLRERAMWNSRGNQLQDLASSIGSLTNSQANMQEAGQSMSDMQRMILEHGLATQLADKQAAGEMAAKQYEQTHKNQRARAEDMTEIQKQYLENPGSMPAEAPSWYIKGIENGDFVVPWERLGHAQKSMLMSRRNMQGLFGAPRQDTSKKKKPAKGSGPPIDREVLGQ